MTGADVALVLTAAGTLFTAVSTGFALVWREIRAARRDTAHVRHLVNGERTANLRYQAALVEQLNLYGVPVPLDPYLTVTSPEREHAERDNDHGGGKPHR